LLVKKHQWHKVATGLPQGRQVLSISRHIWLIADEIAAEHGFPTHFYLHFT
jgi:hypothetical protein